MIKQFIKFSAILLIAILISAPGPQTGGFGMGGNPRPNNSAPQFQFASESGSGMSLCSSSNPTGSKGQTISFTRGSSTTCARMAGGPYVTTGIANGDLTSISSGIVRQTYDAQGFLGIQIQQTRTNSQLRSEQLDNAAWLGAGVGVAAPVVTANVATSPMNTVTAEQLDLAATGAGQVSTSLQPVAGAVCNAVTCVYSIYIKGVSGSGTIDFGGWGTIVALTSCSFVSTSWTRCIYVAASGNAGSGIFLGNDTRDNGGTSRPAQSIYAWGAQGQVGPYVSSYIATTSAAVTRSADQNPQFSGVPLAGLASSGSSAASITPAATSGMNAGVIIFNTAGRPIYSGGPNMRIWDGTTQPSAAAGYVFNTTKRYWSSWSGSTKTITNATDAVTVTDAFDGTMNTTGPLQIGASTVIGLGGDWVVSRVKLDPNPEKCR